MVCYPIKIILLPGPRSVLSAFEHSTKSSFVIAFFRPPPMCMHMCMCVCVCIQRWVSPPHTHTHACAKIIYHSHENDMNFSVQILTCSHHDWEASTLFKITNDDPGDVLTLFYSVSTAIFGLRKAGSCIDPHLNRRRTYRPLVLWCVFLGWGISTKITVSPKITVWGMKNLLALSFLMRR